MNESTPHEVKDINILHEVAKRQQEESNRYFLLLDLYEASRKLFNFKVEISVKKKESLF